MLRNVTSVLLSRIVWKSEKIPATSFREQIFWKFTGKLGRPALQQDPRVFSTANEELWRNLKENLERNALTSLGIPCVPNLNVETLQSVLRVDKGKKSFNTGTTKVVEIYNLFFFFFIDVKQRVFKELNNFS